MIAIVADSSTRDYQIRPGLLQTFPKHFAHQLRDLAAHRETLYASWPQLVLATEVASREPARRGLVELVDRLREIPELQSAYEHQPEEATRWSVGELTFVTFQPE